MNLLLNRAHRRPRPVPAFARCLAAVSACFVFAAACAAAAFSQEPAKEEPTPEKMPLPAGHSTHGEAFNEGPRQAAYLMGNTGRVRFNATTKSDEARPFIDQGVGQLHGFWYFEAERSFRQAAALDPDAPIPYWGMAMANANNEKRAAAFIAEAAARKANAGEREGMYIAALEAYIKAGAGKKKERAEAYIGALDKIAEKYPDDLDAKAWLALAMWNNRSAGVPIASYAAVDALLSEVFQAEPLHPAHHYRIHLWDDRKADKALASAALCGEAAPGIAHMWHMPGHIYSKLRRYDEAAWQQEASARVDHAHMMRDGILPDRIHNFAHNNEWLIRNLMYVGRARHAVDLAKNMIELPRHPKYNALEKRGTAYYGRLRLGEVLTRYELWEETIALCHSPYLDAADDPNDTIKRRRLLGAAYARHGELDAARGELAWMNERLAAERAAQETAGQEADGKNEKDAAKAKADARRPLATRVESLEKAAAEIEGHLLVAAGDAAGGLALLKKAGGVEVPYLARVQLAADDKTAAEKALRDYLKNRAGEVLPLAALADFLWRTGRRDEAGKLFHQLRGISPSMDFDAPPLARLATIAAEQGLPEDWRLAPSRPADFGSRPELDSLGPFRWQPSPAPAWTLADAMDRPHGSKDFEGRPVVILFYLGYGCLHCAEQIQAFGPLAKPFDEAGISLVAISSDDRQGLLRSIENYKDGPIPFPLVADPELSAFRAYRAYDDFEKQPLHGTFFVDGAGRIRWHDVSYEPFMDGAFLLKEAKRLLAQ